MRRGWFVLVVGGLLVYCPAAPAQAAPARAAAAVRAKPAPTATATALPRDETRIGYLVARLKKDPVFVTDQVPRELPQGTAGKIRALVGRLGVRTYVAVTLHDRSAEGTTDTPMDADALVPILHDRLGKDGIYIVIDPGGDLGAVQQFGGARKIDVKDAYEAATSELPFEATVLPILQRFVDIALSGQARQRADHPHPRPESQTRRELDAYDRGNHEAEVKNMTALGIGGGVSGVAVLAALVRRRRRRKARRLAPRQGRAVKQGGGR